MGESVDNRNSLTVLRQVLLLLFRHKSPQFIDINNGAPDGVASYVVVPHTNFTKITRVVLDDATE